MNIIRGIDRIALVLAIIAIVPGFFVGGYYVSEQFSTITPEYKEWEEKYGDVWQQEMRYAPAPPHPKVNENSLSFKSNTLTPIYPIVA